MIPQAYGKMPDLDFEISRAMKLAQLPRPRAPEYFGNREPTIYLPGWHVPGKNIASHLILTLPPNSVVNVASIGMLTLFANCSRGPGESIDTPWAEGQNNCRSDRHWSRCVHNFGITPSSPSRLPFLYSTRPATIPVPSKASPAPQTQELPSVEFSSRICGGWEFFISLVFD